MSDRYIFIYFMKDDPEAIVQTAPLHVRYWHDLGLAGYLGGPFSDRSGGAISFEADGEMEAQQLVAGDPFVVAGHLSQTWLRQWQIG